MEIVLMYCFSQEHDGLKMRWVRFKRRGITGDLSDITEKGICQRLHSPTQEGNEISGSDFHHQWDQVLW